MPRGGARTGAGRHKRYGCETKPVRLPVTAIASVLKFIKNNDSLKFPLYSSKVPAGFPSPADDHIEEHLDLNDLIKHPAATFLVRATGNSMKDAGINENDLLIVDRSLLPTQGKVVVAAVDGQLTVKRINKENGKLFLMPANSEFSPIEIKEENDIHIWGVVTKVIHDM
jgi:DNA polymerase V